MHNHIHLPFKQTPPGQKTREEKDFAIGSGLSKEAKPILLAD